MIRAGAGYATAANPRTAAFEATAAALAQAGLRAADAAICFASSAYAGAYPLIVRSVADAAGTAQVAGCSTLGVIAGGREFERGPSLAVAVIGGGTITPTRCFAPQLRGRAREAACAIADQARPRLGANNLLCLFPDSYNLDPEPFLATLERELPGVTIVGGGATEDGATGETIQFCGDVTSSNAVSGMLLAGDFDLTVAAANACAPIGAAHRVTAVRDNVILELDGRRAWDVFAEAAGPLAADLPRALGFVFLGVPLAADAERIERGRFVVRNIVGASAEHGAIAVAHRAQVGEMVGFVLRDAGRARSELKAALEQVATQRSAPAALGLYFDCVSRGTGLYQMADHDAAYIGQYLGATPIAGFFTGFEIGPMGDRAGLLQYCGVLALIGDKPT